MFTVLQGSQWLYVHSEGTIEVRVINATTDKMDDYRQRNVRQFPQSA